MEQNSVEKQVRDILLSWGRGRIFFIQDFAMVSNAVCIRQVLCKLTEERFICRIAYGVYCFPKVEGEYGFKTIYPSTETIAEAIAEHWGARIVPDGERAAYLMGLTELQMNRYDYLTDFAPKVIKTNNTVIRFKHTSEMRIFSFVNKDMQLLSLGIRAIGKGNVTQDMRRIIQERLSKISKEEFAQDIQLCPEWVQEVMFDD